MSAQRQPYNRVRFKFLLREPLAYGANEAGLEDNPEWPRFVRITDIDGSGRLRPDTFKSLEPITASGYMLDKGDVLLARSGATVGKAFLYHESWGPACYAGYLIRARLKLALCWPQFVYYFSQSSLYWDQVKEGTIQATIQNFSAEKFGDLTVPVPPLGEQRRIAAYLDAETAQMDGLVAEKEQMLKLLEEKRAAQISHAVTRGLNPRAPLKPSALPWLGDIPKHWNLQRSKWLLKERDERSETGEEEMLTVSHLTGVTPRSEKDVNMFEAETNEGYKLVSPDQLVINTLWAWMGAMGVARHEGIVSPAYHVYRIMPELLPEYVDYLVRTEAFKAEVIRFSKGVWSSRLRLYPEGLHEVWLPVPPLTEQRAIVAHLTTERERTAELEVALRDSIQLLQERRRALITAAVTGQIAFPERTA